MPYYCKKCGAVVTGKFCSCCGTQATTDLADFKRELRRWERRFKDMKYRDQKDFVSLHAASFAWFSAEETILDYRRFSVDTFPEVSETMYALLPMVEDKADALYNYVMRGVGIMR